MRQTKFSMNAFVLVYILFSAAFLFVSVYLYDFADFSKSNDSYPIEGTDLFVRYADHIPSGIYDGEETYSNCLIEGRYGYNGSAQVSGNQLFINEYHNTKYGFMISDLMCISTDDFRKRCVAEDAYLLGTCKSGELVFVRGTGLANWFVQTNGLYPLYLSSSSPSENLKEGPEVIYLDPVTSEEISAGHDPDALSEKRQNYYLSRTLSEVKNHE